MSTVCRPFALAVHGRADFAAPSFGRVLSMSSAVGSDKPAAGETARTEEFGKGDLDGVGVPERVAVLAVLELVDPDDLDVAFVFGESFDQRLGEDEVVEAAAVCRQSKSPYEGEDAHW